MEKNICEGLSNYEVAYWIVSLESKPVKVVKDKDISGSYEMEKFSILELENGKFATVHESGCSCYSISDAEIELHPDLKSAETSFDKWEKKERYR